jgi:KDO2-lipid IV(A) lauroyltransferase
MGHLVPSKAGAAISLARILENGGNVGVLVDQKFNGGLKTTFFGQPCLSSPLLARLARQFDCDIHPAHSIRLPDGRFHLMLEEKMPIPRLAGGRVDVHALTQAVNDKVEEWVRADPGQWMWFHKRWKMG